MKDKTYQESLEDFKAAWHEFIKAIMEAISDAVEYSQALSRLEKFLKERKAK